MTTKGLDGRVCVVTGATSGIGKASAAGLARLGATVVLIARDKMRGEATAAEIGEMTGNDKVMCLVADLASQQAIRTLVAEIQDRHQYLHTLVNCAAVFTRRRVVGESDLELMFAVNHLAPFLLTNLLVDQLKAGAPSSVTTVTAPSTTRLNFGDLQSARRFGALHAFGASKMANLLFTFALARRLSSTGVVANAYHPGIVHTNLMRDAPLPIRWFTNLVGRSAERAAEGLVSIAGTNADGVSGRLFKGTRPIAVSAYARDEQVQERLWIESSRLVGLAPEN